MPYSQRRNKNYKIGVAELVVSIGKLTSEQYKYNNNSNSNDDEEMFDCRVVWA